MYKIGTLFSFLYVYMISPELWRVLIEWYAISCRWTEVSWVYASLEDGMLDFRLTDGLGQVLVSSNGY